MGTGVPRGVPASGGRIQRGTEGGGGVRDDPGVSRDRAGGASAAVVGLVLAERERERERERKREEGGREREIERKRERLADKCWVLGETYKSTSTPIASMYNHSIQNNHN